jgi:excisionase family DNA binding protein
VDYRELLRHVRLRPGIIFGRSELNYEELVKFVIGLQHGRPDQMSGFREFLVLKLNDGDNLGWPTLVARLVVPHAGHPLSPEDDQAAVHGLLDLLDEFLAETAGSGSRAIDREYLLWLQQQSWYNLELARFDSSPAPRMLTLDEAADQLGLQREAVFDWMASRTLRSFRVGAELLFREGDVAQLRERTDPDEHQSSGPDNRSSA